MWTLFQGTFGYADQLRRDDSPAARRADEALDLALARSANAARLNAGARTGPKRNILAILTADPARRLEVASIAKELTQSRHGIRLVIDSRPEKWKFVKINEAIQSVGDGLARIDWLIIVDDDVVLWPHFVDEFIGAAEAGGLVLAQPAHRIHSFASYAVTQRKAGSLVRATRFVEIGPVVAIHRSLFGELVPFAETRWGWGIDFVWADKAWRAGWRIGVVDCTPFEHLRPIGANYPAASAIAEAAPLLDRQQPVITREAMLGNDEILIAL